MKRSEWIECLGLMRVNWPHVSIDETVAAKWFADLQDLPGDQVKAAIETLYRDGREFPPNGAQILRKVSELGRDDPDHGEAWRLARRASRKADPQEAFRWLFEQSPAAAEAVQEMSGFQLSYQLDDEATVRAQFRDIYKQIVARNRRDDTYAGLPSAGLRGLERGPRKLGGALQRVLGKRPAALGQGDRSEAA
ncbi:MAG TPA: hypothetical protein VLC07_09250 [Solirubrobacterales bacterium]|nr:hypothetical protein [Solirubrobacterales bacterium]